METFQLPVGKAGDAVRCPACQSKFYVPPSSAPAPNAPPNSDAVSASPPPIKKKPIPKVGGPVLRSTPARPIPGRQPPGRPGSAPPPLAKRTFPWLVVAGAGLPVMLGGVVVLAGLLWLLSRSPSAAPVVAEVPGNFNQDKFPLPNPPVDPGFRDKDGRQLDPPNRDRVDQDKQGKPNPPRDKQPADKPATDRVVIEKPPPVEPDDPGSRRLAPATNLADLQKSDHLMFDLPPLPANAPPAPAAWTGHSNHIRGLAYSDDGQFVVSLSGDAYQVLVNGRQRPADNSIRVWDARRGLQIHKWEGFREPLDGLSLSRGGRYAVFGHGGHWEGDLYVEPRESHVRMVDILTRREIFLETPEGAPADDTTPKVGRARFQGLNHAMFCSAFSPTGQHVFGGSNHSQFMLWEVKTGRQVFANDLNTLSGWRKGITKCQFTPDGRHVVVSMHDSRVLVIDAETGRVKTQLGTHFDIVWSVAVTKTTDGRTLALSGGGYRQLDNGMSEGNRDYAIRLWDVQKGREIRRFHGHQQMVHALAFRPRSTQFLSGAFDNNVCLWDWQTGKLLRTFKGHTNQVRSLAIAPDGRSAVSGDDGCQIRYWQLPAVAGDLGTALEKNIVLALERAIGDMDTMGPDLHSAFGPLVRALTHGQPAMRPLARKALLAYGQLWRENALPEFSQADFEALTTLRSADSGPELQELAGQGLNQLAAAMREPPAVLTRR